MKSQTVNSACFLLLLTLGLPLFINAPTVWAADEIRAAQESLLQKGYDPGPADGFMGARTAQALREFQQDNNLSASGKLDGKTAQLLGLVLKSTGATAGKNTQSLVIPFQDLEPYWSEWKKWKRKEDLGVFCKRGEKHTVLGVLVGVSKTMAFDSRGLPVAPTKPGSKLVFETQGCRYGWINGIVISADNRIVFEVREGSGLVYVSGNGIVTLASGRQVVVGSGKVNYPSGSGETEARQPKPAKAENKQPREKVQKQQQDELKTALESEEAERRMNSLRQAYILAIRAKIWRNWRRPKSNNAVTSCVAHVLQGPGGIILDVSFAACAGGDKVYRASIEKAIYRAEPLPAPPDKSLFERELKLVFADGN